MPVTPGKVPVTTLATYRSATPAAAALPAIQRFARSAATGAALLAQSFLFAREMQSAHTPAAQRRVLDTFTV
jgi:hypothetical protein